MAYCHVSGPRRQVFPDETRTTRATWLTHITFSLFACRRGRLPSVQRRTLGTRLGFAFARPIATPANQPVMMGHRLGFMAV